MVSARLAALQCLERYRRDGAWVSSVMDGIIRSNALSRRDAALVSALTLGVLQNSVYFDFLISRFCSTKPEKLEKKVLDILRLGVCQLILLNRIPARAAVNETVGLCDQVGLERAKPLVNAVLRRIAEQRDCPPEVPGIGSAAYLSTRYSHPLWLAEKLIKEKGYAFADALFRADNAIPPLTLQINTAKISSAEYLQSLDEHGISYTVPAFPEDCVCISGYPVSEVPGYEEGLFYIQDRAARMAVDLIGLKDGMRVLDACASPGGKSLAAALNIHLDGEVLACDIHEKKLSLIQSNAARLGIEIIQTQCRDARVAVCGEEESYDAVIADVPCSGFGVIAKKPEIRSKLPEELRALPQIQSAILETVCRYVRPDGILLYSTCTILKEENEDVVEAFLAGHPDFQRVPFTVGEREAPQGVYTFYPHVDGTDGFFAAKLKRIKI